ncbi:apoptosis regulator BAX-like [Anableps anableps]
MASGGAQGTLKDTIVDELVVLLKDFIWRWIQRHGLSYASTIRKELGAKELCSPHQQKVSQALQDVGDQVDGDGQLQRFMKDPSIIPSKDMFIKVVVEIFSDGKINWGRVVSVFYFTCLLVMKAHETNICDMIKSIITWTIDYFLEKVVNWIKEQGGWEGIFSYIGTPTWQAVAIFLAGVLTTLFVTHNVRRV